ncbi:MAG TPA: hypothetical protein VI455_02195 [Terriglobia bacterium]
MNSTDKHPDPWDYSLQRALKAQEKDLTDSLVNGLPEDFAGYRYICGQIRGIHFAMAEITRLREKLQLVEDETWYGIE